MINLADQTNEEKCVPMIYQLSNAGIDVNARDYKGRTALELAIFRELQELMMALLRVGVDPTEMDYKTKIRDFGSPFEYELINSMEKFEPGLWGAVAKNDTGMVHMLVNSWCRINIVKNNQTLMQFAQNNVKSEDIFNILDDYEVTIEFVHATLAGDEKRMLEFLMDSKPCDPSIMDISYQERWSKPLAPRSLRDTALAMGHQHVLHLLPEDDEVDDLGQGQGHHHKTCSATVIGNTSMLDTDSMRFDKSPRETSPNGDVSKEGDSDSVQYSNNWNYKNGRKISLKKRLETSLRKRHSNSDDYITDDKTPLEPDKTGDDGTMTLTGVEEKCFLFHEVDNFVAQIDPTMTDNNLKTQPSIRAKKADNEVRDYSHNWDKVEMKQSKSKARSKMCVIS